MDAAKQFVRFFLITGILVVFVPGSGWGQSGNAMQQEGGAHYVVPGMGQSIKIRVNLWGEVARPGIYTIPTDMSLVTLVSSAGGPSEYAKLKEVKVIRTNPESGNSRVIEVNMENYLKRADTQSTRFALRPNDTVYIPSSFRRYFSETLGIAGSIASILATFALLYERLWRAGVW